VRRDITLATGLVTILVCFIMLGAHMYSQKRTQQQIRTAMLQAQHEATEAKRSEIETLQSARKEADDSNQATSNFMSYVRLDSSWTYR
jgi:Tfp pilus assembly protein PilN